MKALSISAVLAGVAAVLAFGSARSTPEEVTVRVGNFAFIPATITVAAGTKVRWVNEDDVPHTVVGVGQDTRIKSPPLDTGDEYAVVLERPGTYKYFCSLHPHMVGTVLVN